MPVAGGGVGDPIPLGDVVPVFFSSIEISECPPIRPADKQQFEGVTYIRLSRYIFAFRAGSLFSSRWFDHSVMRKDLLFVLVAVSVGDGGRERWMEWWSYYRCEIFWFTVQWISPSVISFVLFIIHSVRLISCRGVFIFAKLAGISR